MSCPQLLGKVVAIALLLVTILASQIGAPRAESGETPEEVFRKYISEQIIQERCVNCHVRGGLSAHTRLVFVRASDAPDDHVARNLAAIRDFLAGIEDGGVYVLLKVQGALGHGGLRQLLPGSVDFAAMERFLALLSRGSAFPSLAPETLFDTVVMASPRKTLRRAALIFAGRIPTDEEYAAVEAGDESVLRAAIRDLMTGPEFHDFLIRGSNDRLLTDRNDGYVLDNNEGYLVELTNEAYRRRQAAYAGGNLRPYYDWMDRVQHGARRAPLELIAHVVENDLPYTEILTADYIMANPWSAFAYGASTSFSDSTDAHEFRPSRIVEYYRHGDGYQSEYDPDVQALRVDDPGPLITDYPHAGILNTTAFLRRYPTTATNRNRARARWTYYHFLGLDVEKSASRTTDPVALADTNNPTMHNPACTVCHSVLDPVAGAFQNYGDDGYYRDKWGGQDSLDDLYKDTIEGSEMAVHGESWADRETLVWPLGLAAGAETLRVEFTNDFYDEGTGEDGMIYLDLLRVADADGQVLASHEFEDLGPPIAHWGPCGGTGGNPDTGLDDHLVMWNGYRHCAFYIDVEVPNSGIYDVEIVVWAPRYEQYGDGGFARLSVVVDTHAYHEGDTWYRDMRFPGFAGETAPYADNSLQWLAERIVADERFAEATVKFWWPAIMGREVAEPPEDASDADFEGLLLAANAQDAEMVRLAGGFRDGFEGSPHVYNLKDLLVEIVLSKWFRAAAVMDEDPVRRTALRHAGARRLLTPEELAHKTAALTGVQWGRNIGIYCWPLCQRRVNQLTGDYRVLYGGIDSGGITARARDITTVMAGVAKRHAAQVSCAAVGRELYLLPDAKRRLFAGISPRVTSAGAVKRKLVELHDKLLGVEVDVDSPDVAAKYRLFTNVMRLARSQGHDWFNIWDCGFWEDVFFFDGILDDVIEQIENSDGYRYYGFNENRRDQFMHGIDFSDRRQAAQAWVAVLAAMMLDYRYLYLQ